MGEDTIFYPAFGNRPTSLVGRTDTLKQIDACLASRPGSRERASIILGQRGSGKTVLLWEVADRALARGQVVATPTIVAEGMLGRIVEKIQESGARYARHKKLHLTGANLSTPIFKLGLEFTAQVQEQKSDEYKLTQLVRALSQAGHGVVILIDELQANAPEMRSLIAVYQELVGEGNDITLVMAGLPGAVSALLNDKVLTFLNRAQKLSLPPLRAGDIDAFYAQSFAKLAVEIAPDLRKKAVTATGGSPYLMQLIGHYIVLYAEKGKPVDGTLLATALATAQTEFENDVCETTLHALSDKDRAFLAAMAPDAESSKIAEVAQRMGVSTDYAQKYRRRLIDAGIIESKERGVVAFAVPYLASYLTKNNE